MFDPTKEAQTRDGDWAEITEILPNGDVRAAIGAYGREYLFQGDGKSLCLPSPASDLINPPGSKLTDFGRQRVALQIVQELARITPWHLASASSAALAYHDGVSYPISAVVEVSAIIDLIDRARLLTAGSPQTQRKMPSSADLTNAVWQALQGLHSAVLTAKAADPSWTTAFDAVAQLAEQHIMPRYAAAAKEANNG